MKQDFMRYACCLPCFAGNIGKGYIDVASRDFAVFGEGKRHGGAAVTGKDANFQIFLGIQ